MEDNQDEVEDEYYSDDPVVDPKIDWYYKLRSFAPIAILLLVTTIYLPSTVGGKITLNSDRTTEFGQAVRQAVACSDTGDIRLTPFPYFSNARNSNGTHYLGSVKIANLPSSCSNKDFELSVYSETATTAGLLFGASNKLRFYFGTNGDFYTSANSSDLTVSSESQACVSPLSGTCRSVTLEFLNPTFVTNTNLKISLMSEQKSVWSCSKGGLCALGDTGPGGGVVFYVAPTTFTSAAPCGSACKYLESALKTWNGGSSDPKPQLANCNTSVNVNLTAIGQGFANTRDLDCQNASTGRTLVWGVTIGGKRDWYIPAVQELLEMCNYSSTTGVCAGNSSKTPSLNVSSNYFASNSKSTEPGYMQYFAFFINSTGYVVRATDGNKSLRPIRAF